MKSYSYGTTPIGVIKKAIGNKPFPAELTGELRMAAIKAVNQGIDSHLEAITSSQFDDIPIDKFGNRLKCLISPKDMLVFLRRLSEIDDIAAMSLRIDILDSFGIEEI